MLRTSALVRTVFRSQLFTPVLTQVLTRPRAHVLTPARTQVCLHTTEVPSPPQHGVACSDNSINNTVKGMESFSALDKFITTQDKSKLIVIDFFAEWCAPCRFSLKGLSQLAEEFHTAEFISVDIDQVPETVGKFGIDAVPKIIFVRDKERVGVMTGPSNNSLRNMIRSLLGLLESEPVANATSSASESSARSV